MKNQLSFASGGLLLGLPNELLRKSAVFLCPTDVVLASRACRRLHATVCDHGFVMDYIRQNIDSDDATTFTDGENCIRTLEQLAFSQSKEVRDLLKEHRLGFDFASVEIAEDEPPISAIRLLGFDDVNVRGSESRLASIQRLVLRFGRTHKLRIRVDAHCGTLAPNSVAPAFAVARSHAVRDALADASVPIQTVGWGKTVSAVCAARSCDHRFAELARTGVGWAEVYLELDGWKTPPRPSYYADFTTDDEIEEDDDSTVVDDETVISDNS